ncbi:FAD-binding protein [Streptomyces sp. NPDC127178]|uniref:FAD-binding protein n=1 Tax=unclassified Streptomyces TaxID=2593676 RepID=UPI00364138D4
MKTLRLTNWAGNVEFAATGRACPTTVAEVAQAVRAAGPGGIRVAGRGHSFSPVGDTQGLLVSLQNLPRLSEPVRDYSGAVTGARVGGGLTYGQVCPRVDAWGCALPVLDHCLTSLLPVHAPPEHTGPVGVTARWGRESTK